MKREKNRQTEGERERATTLKRLVPKDLAEETSHERRQDRKDNTECKQRSSKLPIPTVVRHLYGHDQGRLGRKKGEKERQEK